MLELDELKTRLRVRGLVAAGQATIVPVELHGDGTVIVVFRDDDGHIADRLLETSHLAAIEVAEDRRSTFGADGQRSSLHRTRGASSWSICSIHLRRPVQQRSNRSQPEPRPSAAGCGGSSRSSSCSLTIPAQRKTNSIGALHPRAHAAG
ncbi:MAG TPA: hypothetical protein VFJ85_16990 [Acidimicrobiales bacterium]|nr:hypothetical protein [Acidimicrobiales bacterium]